MDNSSHQAILQILKQFNLKGTEEVFKREAKVDDSLEGQDSDVISALTADKNDPNKYLECYAELKHFADNALDIYKYEIGTILYPVLVHMYLELISNETSEEAIKLMKIYGPVQDIYYQEDLKKIALVTKPEHIDGNEFIDTFKTNQFIIRISRDTLSYLKIYLDDKKDSVLTNIVQDHLYFDMYEGVARSKRQIDSTSGGIIGEATRQENKTKVYYGLPKAPDIKALTAPAEDEDNAEGDSLDKPKKKKAKRDSLFSKRNKSDPNAPSIDRIPFPNLRDADKHDKIKALKEASKRLNFNNETSPSICCYNLLNTNHTVTCAEISEDSSMLAVGFSESFIKVWTLIPQKLRALKTASQLQTIDADAEDVGARIMDERSGEKSRLLIGHKGNVYSVSFSPDRKQLLSCSEDTEIRLWSLQIWNCLVVYKGHLFPVWDVKFSPLGYYFASASYDKTGRLWATDNNRPLRIFAGHFASVDCIQFHPNSNYVATGSSDRRVCLWDCTNGNSVRLMTGHKSQIHSLAFSVCGRYLSSAGIDCKILIWDLAHGNLLAEFSGHNKPIHSLSFSHCGNVLTSGSLDHTIKFWDFNKLSKETKKEDVDISPNLEVRTGDNYLLHSYSTKSSPILHLHYTRRNLLMAVTMFDGSTTT